MADKTVASDSIGPQLALDDVELPSAVGDRLATAYGVDGTIEHGAEWVDAMQGSLADDVGRSPTPDDLCTSPDGRHSFTSDDGTESQSYVCVLDPLIYPFLTDTPGTVRSETPEDGTTVEISVGTDGVAVSHADAVVSLGAADAIDTDAPVTFERVYQQVCGYIHVFADRAEYEQWAGDVDGETTAVPVSEGVAVARELAGELFD